LLLVAAAVSLSCRREPAAPLAQETFVEVMVALRRASTESADQADFEARKQVILERAGVTEDELRAYARRASRDARALSDAYDSISARLQRLSEPE
jgi:hypothetical protein